MSLNRLVMDIVLADMAGNGIRRLAGDVKNLGAAGAKASMDFERMGTHIERALKGVTVARELKAAVLDVGLGAASSIQDAMAKVRIQLPVDMDVDGAMGKLRREADKLAIPLPFDTKQMVDAAGELLKAGMSMDDVLGGGLAAVGKAAALSGQDPATTAAQAVVLKSKLGLSGAQLPAGMDLVSRAADASNADIGGIVSGLSMSNGWRGTNEELLATLALASNYKIDGTQAGTSISGIMSHLPDLAKKSGGRIRGYDTRGEFVGMPALLEQMRHTFESLTPEKRARLKQDLFGNEVSTGALVDALLQRGALEDVQRSMRGARSLDSKVGELAGTEKAAWDSVRASGESLLAAVYEPLLSPSTGLAQTINDALASVSEYAGENPTVAKGASALSVGAVGAAGLYSLYQLTRAGGAGLSGMRALMGGARGTATDMALGVVAGKMGYTPVFVVNWPSALGAGSAASTALELAGGGGGSLAKSLGIGATASMGLAAAGVASAGYAGWEIGTAANNNLVEGSSFQNYLQASFAQGSLMFGAPFLGEGDKQGLRNQANSSDLVRAFREAFNLNVTVNVDGNGNASVVTDRASDGAMLAAARSGAS